MGPTGRTSREDTPGGPWEDNGGGELGGTAAIPSCPGKDNGAMDVPGGQACRINRPGGHRGQLGFCNSGVQLGWGPNNTSPPGWDICTREKLSTTHSVRR